MTTPSVEKILAVRPADEVGYGAVVLSNRRDVALATCGLGLGDLATSLEMVLVAVLGKVDGHAVSTSEVQIVVE
jgi:hypothetical protein